MSDIIQDSLDTVFARTIAPTHTIVFEALVDAAELLDTAYNARVVDSLDSVSFSSTIEGDATQDLRDTILATSSLSAVRTWYRDLLDTAQGWDGSYAGASIFIDVAETAIAGSTADGLYPPITVSDYGAAFSLLDGSANNQPIAIDTAALFDRTHNLCTTDVSESANLSSGLTALQEIVGDVLETAGLSSSLSSQVERVVDVVDLSKTQTSVTARLDALTRLVDNGFVFSRLASSPSMLSGSTSTVMGNLIPSNNTEPFPLGLVFTTDTAWTCNVQNFAMSSYSGDITSSDETSIVTTGRQMFGSHRSKRLARAYVQSDYDTALTMKAMADGRGQVYANQYSVPKNTTGVGPETQRVKLGRGVTGDRWAFQIEGKAPLRLESFSIVGVDGVLSHA